MTAYNINSQRLTVIPVPFDAKRVNCYISGSNVIIETIAEYLARVLPEIRDVTPVYMIIPKDGYSAGTFPIATLSATLANFDTKKYAFVGGLTDVNFTDITDETIGNRTYTENNIITDEESITDSLDKLDMSIGDIQTILESI